MEENHDEQHFTERELAGSQAFAARWDQLFPLEIFEDLCKVSDTAKQSGDRRVHEGGILSVGFDFGTDTKSGSARFWKSHQPAYPELGLLLGLNWFFIESGLNSAANPKESCKVETKIQSSYKDAVPGEEFGLSFAKGSFGRNFRENPKSNFVDNFFSRLPCL